MLRDIHFLIIGNIFLTIGLLGYFTNNPFLGCLAFIIAIVCFVRQLITLYVSKPKDDDTTIKS
jgi:hypothetical protein